MGPTRLNIPAAGGRGATLRVTRDPGQHKVVFSHWRDGRLIASTPVELSELPMLIGVLVDALGEAVGLATRPSILPRRFPQFVSAMHRALHPRLAQVTEIRSPRDRTDAMGAQLVTGVRSTSPTAGPGPVPAAH